MPNKMKSIHVGIPNKSYNILVGSNIVEQAVKKIKIKSKLKRAFIIWDDRLVDAQQKLYQALLKSKWEVHSFSVKAGEELKDIESVYPIYGQLLGANANRDSVVFALGGGSVGDAVGFVASTYLRGIRWVGVPTTLLAQVDSSLGGKTGINHSAGKNLIGSFYQPIMVICETQFLSTLSMRERVSGFGEAIKYAIAFDPKFYLELVKNKDKFLNLEPRFLVNIVSKCLKWKSKKVSKDEFDVKGIREALNFGHTFGHTLEAFTYYKVYQHGEAVIWGMRFALLLSEIRKKITPLIRRKVDDFLKKLPIPNLPQDLSDEILLSLMQKDKKVRDGKLNFVLSKGIGKVYSDNKVKKDEVIKAFSLLKNEGERL